MCKAKTVPYLSDNIYICDKAIGKCEAVQVSNMDLDVKLVKNNKKVSSLIN